MAQSPQKRSVTSRYSAARHVRRTSRASLTFSVPTVESSTRSAPCTSPPPAARIRGQGPNRIRGLRLRAATGGCKIPCANIIRYVKKHNRPHNPHILKSRRKNGPVRPESAGIRQVQKPAHENMCRPTETTARFGRSASRTVVPCRDDSPLSTHLLEKKPRAAARQNAKSTFRILGARKRKAPPGTCAAGTAAPYSGMSAGKRPGNGNVLLPNERTEREKAFPET